MSATTRHLSVHGWENGHMKPHPYAPVSERFWSRVDMSDERGCWPWTGSMRHRYGEFWVNGQGKSYAHRVAYELTYGPLKPGEVVCHHCDNPPCVRPSHLFVGSQADNIADGRAKGRMMDPPHGGRNQFTGVTHCIHGHEFTPENTRLLANGRQCRTCQAEGQRRRRARMKAAGIRRKA